MTDRFKSDRRPVPVVSEGPAITSGLSREGSSNETRASDFGGLWQLNSDCTSPIGGASPSHPRRRRDEASAHERERRRFRCRLGGEVIADSIGSPRSTRLF